MTPLFTIILPQFFRKCDHRLLSSKSTGKAELFLLIQQIDTSLMNNFSNDFNNQV